jgi:tetratricopeptide (TPR) repeat protein
VVEICRKLDGLPLAIELAAARSKLLSPPALLHRLDHRLQILVGGAQDLPDRQQTLRAAITWSYDLLTPEEQGLFQRLAIFAGGASLEAVEAVCGPSIGVDADLLGLVESLVDQNLVRLEDGDDGATRVQLLETIREFANERLVLSGEADTLHARHCSYFLLLAERAEAAFGGPQQGAWFAQLEAEHDNLRAALAWSQTAPAAIDGVRLAGMLAQFWWVRGHWSEGRRWLEPMLHRVGDAPHVHARALLGAALLAHAQGDHATATAYAEESLTLARDLGDERAVAAALATLGAAVFPQGDADRARAFYGQSLTLLRRHGDQRGITRRLLDLGTVADAQGDYALAHHWFNQSLVVAQYLRDNRGIARAELALGELAHAQGDYASMADHCHASLERFQELGDRRGVAWSLRALGDRALDLGDTTTAQRWYEQALTLFTQLEARRGIAFVHNCLGNLYQAQGDDARAGNQHEEGLALWTQLGDKRGIAWSHIYFSRLALVQGNHGAAHEHVQAGLTLARALNDREAVCWALLCLADVSLAQGDNSAAWEHCVESLRLCWALGAKRGLAVALRTAANVRTEAADCGTARVLCRQSLVMSQALGERPGIATTLRAMAHLAHAQGEANRAARLLGAAATLQETLALPLTPRERADFDRCALAIRELMGELPFTTAWASGSAILLDEAVAYALEPGDPKVLTEQY